MPCTTCSGKRCTATSVSEVDLTASDDGVPADCTVNFDNIHTLPREQPGRVATLSPARMAKARRTPAAATGC